MHSRHLALSAALLGLLVGIVSSVAQLLPIVVGTRPGEAPGLALGLTFVAFLLSPVAVFGLGYWTGTDVDVSTEYRSIALTIGLVGGVAVFAGYALVVAFALDSPLGADGATVLGAAVQVGVLRIVDFAITGFAGAALAQFRGS
ncbi:hypothetical protein [Haloarchaeobius sp. HRN-SO-5]|uniref:hypothetical protein n=1 Tax=Haloarchaeobius sp. HRN-SO-5 TaxID=3446118 RepID=UPI003EC1453E